MSRSNDARHIRTAHKRTRDWESRGATPTVVSAARPCERGV